jgi:hypothetical protein
MHNRALRRLELLPQNPGFLWIVAALLASVALFTSPTARQVWASGEEMRLRVQLCSALFSIEKAGPECGRYLDSVAQPLWAQAPGTYSLGARP